jgi:4-amino-4-deoxy-L-arabinose transferase-like glycosyltransferase
MVGASIIVLLFFIGCGFLCRAIAIRRGLDRVFWFVAGIVFGPLAIPFLYVYGSGRG